MNGVNGLVLPDKLLKLLAASRWKMPENGILPEKLGIQDAPDLDFLSLAAMAQNTDSLKKVAAQGRGELFGLVSGDDCPTKEGWLDVTRAVMIAATHGQEAICLDYSVGAVPRVVATAYGSERVEWVQIAGTFDELLDILDMG